MSLGKTKKKVQGACQTHFFKVYSKTALFVIYVGVQRENRKLAKVWIYPPD